MPHPSPLTDSFETVWSLDHVADMIARSTSFDRIVASWYARGLLTALDAQLRVSIARTYPRVEASLDRDGTLTHSRMRPAIVRWMREHVDEQATAVVGRWIAEQVSMEVRQPREAVG